MEIFGFLFGFLILLIGFGFFAYALSFAFSRYLNFLALIYITFTKKPFLKHFYLRKKTLPNYAQQTLLKHNLYYSKLSPSDRLVFEHRVVKFIEDKKFIGLEGLKVTHEMKVILAGVAVKLTFGLKRYKLSIVKAIYIFPDIYLSKLSKKWHKGEFNPSKKYVALSWKHALEGVEDVSDNLNLALHEFAHALVLESKIESHDVYFAYNFSKIDTIIKRPEVFSAISKNPYFRDYAQTNRLEFYSVAIECFFETPEEFKKQLPKLYQSFCLLLNNDSLFVYNSVHPKVSLVQDKEKSQSTVKKDEFGYVKSYK